MEQKELLNLIAKSKAGDRSAQEQLVMAVQNKVYYHCKKFLKNEEDAQDATQDVLITMLTNLEKLREPAAFWGWLNTITANRCKNLLTREPKEWQIPEDEDGSSMLDSIETLDDQAIPDQALDNEETRRLVMDMIDGLPAEQRMTVVFFYYDEMSVKDIARTMEVSEGTVKSRLNYARKSIKLEVEKLEKKGTKLYSVSILPFLAYFLRMGAETQTLSPAAAAAVTQGTMAAAETAAAGSAAASASAATGTAGTSTVSAATGTAGTSAASTAAAASGLGAKAAGAVSVKLIAAVLAGVLAVGGIGAAVYVASHSEPEPSPEPSETVMAVTTPEPTPAPSVEATPEPTPEPSEEPQPYAGAYTAKLIELSERLGETARYALVYIDGDDTPELVASTEYGYSIHLYTVTSEGELRTLQEDWIMGRMGPPSYYPGQNSVLVQYSMMAGGDHQELGNTCYRIDEDYQFQEYFQDSGEWWSDDDARTHLPALPEELAGLEREVLQGDLTAQEILERLGCDSKHTVQGAALDFDFSPYVGTYTADPSVEAAYSCEALDLTLNSDGSLSGGGAISSSVWSSGKVSSIPTGTAPIELRSGSEGHGGPGSYTLILRQVQITIEDHTGTVEEYYIIYPQGVADSRGGNAGTARIHYVDATGGVWDMLYSAAPEAE